jgi:hypothetical protein
VRANVKTTLPYNKTIASPPKLPRPAVNILPVTSKVVETIGVNHGRDRRALRPTKKKKKKNAASSAYVSSGPSPLDYGSITQLRELLGLAPPHTSQDAHTAEKVPQDALIVSLANLAMTGSPGRKLTTMW